MSGIALVVPLILAPLVLVAAPAEQAVRPPDPDPLVGQIWTATYSSAAPGSLRIFLADGTLVMTSCVETYRLARWSRISPQRIAWEEDGARIDAEVATSGPDRLELKLLLRGGVRTETYTSASVPFTCPSIRPQPTVPPPGPPRPGAAAPALTPPPAAYRCGDETFRITFETGRAFVTMPDRSVLTLQRTDKERSATGPRTYSNSRVTFVHTSGGSGASVRFARGRRALTDCQLLK